MSFEYKAKIKGRPEPVVVRMEPYGDAPGRISRRNIGDNEAQVWGYLEWGLTEPQSWPPKELTDEEQANIDKAKAFLVGHGFLCLAPGIDVFDVMKQTDIADLYQEWQRADDKAKDKSKDELESKES